MNLSSQVLITKVADPLTAGTSVGNGTGVDMKGYSGCLFLTSFGTPAANNLLHVEGSSVTSTTGYADLAASEVDAAGASDEDMWVDIKAPRKRYLRPVALRGTSSTLGDMWALRYGPKTMPTDNSTAGTIAGKAVLAPSTGTK